jgi:hypothetical protein
MYTYFAARKMDDFISAQQRILRNALKNIIKAEVKLLDTLDH